MAAPVGPRWPDREEKEKGGGVNTKQIPGTNMLVAWSVKPPVNAEGNSRAHCKFFLDAFLLQAGRLQRLCPSYQPVAHSDAHP